MNPNLPTVAAWSYGLAAAAYAASAPRSHERDRFRELLLSRALATGGIDAAQKFFSSIP